MFLVFSDADTRTSDMNHFVSPGSHIPKLPQLSRKHVTAGYPPTMMQVCGEMPQARPMPQQIAGGYWAHDPTTMHRVSPQDVAVGPAPSTVAFPVRQHAAGLGGAQDPPPQRNPMYRHGSVGQLLAAGRAEVAVPPNQNCTVQPPARGGMLQRKASQENNLAPIANPVVVPLYPSNLQRMPSGCGSNQMMPFANPAPPAVVVVPNRPHQPTACEPTNLPSASPPRQQFFDQQ